MATLAVVIALVIMKYIDGIRGYETIMFLVIFGSPIAFIYLLLLGLPVHFVLFAMKKTSLVHYAVSGTSVCLLLLLLVAYIENISLRTLRDVASVLLLSLLGFVASAVFWLIAVKPTAHK